MAGDFQRVNDEVLKKRSNGWRGMIRIESVGGSVSDVIKAEQQYLPEKLIYAEGDSWFDKFTPIPLTGTNLLDAIRTPFITAVVDVSHIGNEAADMAQGWQARQTKAMFDMFEFDAILLSAGGNDLKNLFAEEFKAQAALAGAKIWTQPELDQLANPSNYRDFFDKVIKDIARFVEIRNVGRKTRERRPGEGPTPLLINGYDYLQPRPSGASIFAGTRLGCGPWLYDTMEAAGLTPAQMRAATDAVVDELNSQLTDLCGNYVNVQLINHRGLLVPARHDATGPDADWLDEIHPNEGGFAKLARNRWDVALATALGWTPANTNDLVAAVATVNASTARPA